VVQVTSIMTSTIPFLKPFLVSLESGFLGASYGKVSGEYVVIFRAADRANILINDVVKLRLFDMPNMSRYIESTQLHWLSDRMHSRNVPKRVL
jgi:hypothetical protein